MKHDAPTMIRVTDPAIVARLDALDLGPVAGEAWE